MKITKATRADFIEIHNLYSDKIFRMCFFKTQDKDLAMDLTQQAFLNLWQCYKDGQVVDNPKALVYRITHNLIIDWYRKKKSESLDKLLDNGFDPSDKAHKDDITQYAEFEHTIEALEKLSPEEKQLIIMRYVNDFTPREIARLTNKKENAVSVSIHRAIVNLKKFVRAPKILPDILPKILPKILPILIPKILLKKKHDKSDSTKTDRSEK